MEVIKVGSQSSLNKRTLYIETLPSIVLGSTQSTSTRGEEYLSAVKVSDGIMSVDVSNLHAVEYVDLSST